MITKLDPVWQKKYDVNVNSFSELEQDIIDAFIPIYNKTIVNIPTDEHDMLTGTFTVTISWEKQIMLVDMKHVVIQDKGNKEFKLTVTPTEIRIKLKADVPKELSDTVISFLKTVAAKPEMVNCINTFRGTFRPINLNDSNTYQITMYTDSKKQAYTYKIQGIL